MKIAVTILAIFVALKFAQSKGWFGKDFGLAKDATFLGVAL